jgi:hypothetical protein
MHPCHLPPHPCPTLRLVCGATHSLSVGVAPLAPYPGVSPGGGESLLEPALGNWDFQVQRRGPSERLRSVFIPLAL